MLGDIAVFWNERWNKTSEYQLRFLASKPWTTLMVRGNHDNVDMWSNCKPLPEGYTNLTKTVKLIAGDLREATFNGVSYPSILMVKDTAVLEICGKRCLVISGAMSHDAQHLLDPADPDYRKKKREYDSRHTWYRIIGQTWWPDEDIDIVSATSTLLKTAEKSPFDYLTSQSSLGCLRDIHFDCVFSHDCPAFMNRVYARPGSPGRLAPTKAEEFLERLRETLDYDVWCHGHFHSDWFSYGAEFKSQYCFATDPPSVEHWWENIENHKNVCLYHHIDCLDDVMACLEKERQVRREYSP